MTGIDKIQNDTAGLMLEWIALWGELIVDNEEVIRLDSTNAGEFLFAAELLTDCGVFRQPNEYEFSFVTLSPQLKETYDFEKILYGFYNLGAFYGYGVRFLEEGFKVVKSMTPLFENLVSLQFCRRVEDFYFWTEKTSNLSFEGYGIRLHPRESVYHRHLDTLSIPIGKSDRMRVFNAISLSHKLGIEDLNDQVSVEKAVNTSLNKWRINPSVWPENLEQS